MIPKTTDLKVKIQQVKEAIIYGLYDNEGNKFYPGLKRACQEYEANYDTVRNYIKVKELRKIRQEVNEKQDAAKAGKKREREIEEKVNNDDKLIRSATRMRQAVDIELDRIIEILNNDPHPTRTFGYNLMNCGRALESAQKVYKVSVGEPDTIQSIGEENMFSFSDPYEGIKAIKKTLNTIVGPQSREEAMERYTGKKTYHTTENTKKTDINML